MPPVARPFPRFMADTSQDARPYGDWEQRLRDSFAAACETLAEEAEAPLDPETLRFFPERTWGRKTYVPAVGRAGEEHGSLPEYYGYVFFERDAEGEPGELSADADFTDVTADQNPDWKVDLNDAVIGDWRADSGRGGEVTLIWGTPLVRGALAATAELEGEVLDQAAVNDGRFTLLAVDAVHGFGDEELFLEITLWDRRFKALVAESLYEIDDEDDGEADEVGDEAEPAEPAEPGEDPAGKPAGSGS